MPIAWSRLSPTQRAARYQQRSALMRRGSITVSALRDEGVFEVGCIGQVLFAVTENGVRLFHAEQVRGW